jgi:hypothetical protein
LLYKKVFVPFGINERLPSDTTKSELSKREEKIESFSLYVQKIHKQAIFVVFSSVRRESATTKRNSLTPRTRKLFFRASKKF